MPSEAVWTIEDIRNAWSAGYDAGLAAARRDIGRDFGKPTRVPSRPKRRKKDPKMARALEEANKKGRTAKGKFRKGWDQSRIMKLAHKLKRGM